MNRTIFVTGGAGFIGSNFVRHVLAHATDHIINIDKLTYAGSRANLIDLPAPERHELTVTDICDGDAIRALLDAHRPRAILNFAAESHVDRSIDGPETFVNTNVMGTARLLGASLDYWRELAPDDAAAFRFLHVSTDEVFGSLGPEDPAFAETTPYAPNSPYAASKAAADHLVRAWFHTYGMPVLTTNCSNNYGPYQFPEKLIPVMILNALAGRPLPIYGSGRNVRDWLHVEDHCSAIRTVLERAEPGTTWNIGGDCERTNLQVVAAICDALEQLVPDSPHRPFADLVEHVKDRPGHDARYAMNSARIERELGWRPSVEFEQGLASTVRWYLDNEGWREALAAERQAAERRGTNG